MERQQLKLMKLGMNQVQRAIIADQRSAVPKVKEELMRKREKEIAEYKAK